MDLFQRLRQQAADRAEVDARSQRWPKWGRRIKGRPGTVSLCASACCPRDHRNVHGCDINPRRRRRAVSQRTFRVREGKSLSGDGQKLGACPGWVVDHVVPLACGGVDHRDNMACRLTLRPMTAWNGGVSEAATLARDVEPLKIVTAVDVQDTQCSRTARPGETNISPGASGRQIGFRLAAAQGLDKPLRPPSVAGPSVSSVVAVLDDA